ncbi:MAG: hypothetical protein R6V47_08075 [Candidatus Delongbacteria bacterium]
MTNRFKHKDIIGRIMVSFISILVLAFIILLFMPVPMGDDYHKRSEEKVALNFAATVAQTIAKYYAETDSTGFIGISTGYGGIIQFDHDWYDRNKRVDHYKIDIKIPDDYNCEILDSIVVVTHIDGAQAEVRWR